MEIQMGKLKTALCALVALVIVTSFSPAPVRAIASTECPMVSKAIPDGMCVAVNAGLPPYPPTPAPNNPIGGAGVGIMRPLLAQIQL